MYFQVDLLISDTVNVLLRATPNASYGPLCLNGYEVTQPSTVKAVIPFSCQLAILIIAQIVRELMTTFQVYYNIVQKTSDSQKMLHEGSRNSIQ